MWNYTIDMKKKFVLRKEKGEAHEFIDE